MRNIFMIWATSMGIALTCVVARCDEPDSNGDAVIRATAGDSEIVIRTTSRLAGAIDSLTWKGREFIDSHDHGRQLQSASNFDAGTELSAETFNPTEAGSQKDGSGATSTSRLLHLVATNRQLQTTNQMAFWLTPDEESNGQLAKNKALISNHLLTKRIEIGHGDLVHVIRYNVTFSVPIGEFHRHAVFEAITGYMPAEFERFWKFNSSKNELEPLDDGPGEQSFPVVISTADKQYAIGVFSPDQPSPNYESVGYGRFRFPGEKVVKWNCVFRRDEPTGISAGDYSFRTFVVVGDLKTVTESIRQLRNEFVSTKPLSIE